MLVNRRGLSGRIEETRCVVWSICRCHDKASTVDTLETPQLRGQILEFERRSPKNDHFQAMIMIKVNMHARNDNVHVIVLDITKLVAERPFVMVVHQG